MSYKSIKESELFQGKYCYYLSMYDQTEKGFTRLHYTIVGNCNADDHWQALDKFKRGLGVSGEMERGRVYGITKLVGKKRLFRMEFVF